MFPDDELKAQAFESNNGEWAWPAAVMPRVLPAADSAGLATLGGEVWLVSGSEIRPTFRR